MWYIDIVKFFVISQTQTYNLLQKCFRKTSFSTHSLCLDTLYALLIESAVSGRSIHSYYDPSVALLVRIPIFRLSKWPRPFLI